jgi:hypothetical protein
VDNRYFESEVELEVLPETVFMIVIIEVVAVSAATV